jgi:hypothetical protein
LEINKASGVKEVVPRILTENADYLSEPLKDIYEKCVETGVVYNEW